MKTAQFVAIEKRLLPKLPGFAFKGSLLFINPIDQLLRGIAFDRSGFDKTSFYIRKFVLPLCIPKQYLSYSFGGRIFCTNGIDGWDVQMSDLDEELLSAFRRDALAYLSGLATLDDFIAEVEKGRRDLRSLEALGYCLVRIGRSKEAVAVLDELMTKPNLTIEWQREVTQRVEILKAQILDNPGVAQSQVIAIEAETIQTLGLETYWKGI